MPVRRLVNGVAAAVAAVLLVLGSAAAMPAATSAATRSTAQPPHVMTIMMENTDYSQFAGSPAMPYMNDLAHQYADFTHAYGWIYPSLPNYLELLSGSDEGGAPDCDIHQPGCGPFSNPTLVDQLETAGISWNAYYQGDASGCDQSDGSGNYPYWHNAFRYFADFAQQCSHISNFSDLLSNLSTPTAADFQWVVPDLVNSGGDNGTMSSGDSWLAGELPQIMNTSWYRQGGQIVILYDTGYQDGGGNNGASGGQIPMVVVSAHTKGMGPVTSPVNTAGVLRSVEQAYGVPYLGDAADAANGSLGDALIAGRPTGPVLSPSEAGAVLSLARGAARGPVVSEADTLDLNGIATLPGGRATVEVGQTTGGQGAVVSAGAGAVAVPGTSDLESVSCVNPAQCYAVGLGPSDDDEGVLVSIVSGRPVTTTPLPAFIGLYGIACPTQGTCYGVGYDNSDDADAVTTITNGKASAPVEVTGGGEWLNAISCPTATQCDAVGLVNYSPSLVPIANGVPGTPVTIPDAWYANGIACTAPGTCAVTGENSDEEGIVDLVKGGRAPEPLVIAGSEYLYGAACDAAGNCLLTGSGTPAASGYSAGLVANLPAGGAASVRTLPQSNGFGQIVCPGGGTQYCITVGASFRG